MFTWTFKNLEPIETINIHQSSQEVGIGPFSDVADRWGREYFLNYRMEDRKSKSPRMIISQVRHVKFSPCFTKQLDPSASRHKSAIVWCQLRSQDMAMHAPYNVFCLQMYCADLCCVQASFGMWKISVLSVWGLLWKRSKHVHMMCFPTLSSLSNLKRRKGLWWHDARSSTDWELLECTHSLYCLRNCKKLCNLYVSYLNWE